MAVRLIEGKTYSIPSDTRVLSKKKQLIASSVSIPSLPYSYRNNSPRELTLLQYSEDFRRQFIQLHPYRRSLLLTPLNEAGIQKFITTTIHPTQLPFSILYDLAPCAEFVSDFLSYLPLDDPLKLPEYLPSITSIIQVRAGDCLDIANLLCSLLLGNGYNAYVVSGTAPRWVCENDVSRVKCPLLRDEAAELEKQKEEQLKEEEEEKQRNRYLALVPQLPVHQSKFLAARTAERAAETASLLQQQAQQQSAEWELLNIDPLQNRRAHAWVLVTKGRRDMQEDVFIEPSTGFIYPVHSAASPYLTIESLWNENNYWVNLQSVENAEKPHLQNIRLDLNNVTDWEYVLETEEELDTQQKHTYKNRSTRETRTSEFENEEKMQLEDEKEQMRHKIKRSAIVLTNEKQVSKAINRPREILSLPVSWVGPIRISRDLFQSRYPSGSKTIFYDHCIVEKYSPYSTPVKGLIRKITQFSSETPIQFTSNVLVASATSSATLEETAESRVSTAGLVIEIQETFEHRKDKLYSRITYPISERVHCCFLAGLVHGLAEYIQVEGVSREFIFYPGSRVDGLVRRKELIGVKVIEEYEKRDDRLKYRSITVDTSGTALQTRQKAFGISIGRSCELPIRKLVEKYQRHPTLTAELDVVKRTHSLVDSVIRLDYACPPDGLQGSYWIIDKNDKLESGEVEGISVGSRGTMMRITPGWIEQTRAEQQQQVMKLLTIEKELKVKVKEREMRMTRLVSELESLEDHVTLVENVYDAAYHRAQALTSQANQNAENEENEENQQQHHSNGHNNGINSHHHHHPHHHTQNNLNHQNSGNSSIDYLTPFLSSFPPNQPLNKSQCELVRSACLTAYKDRLVSRANIIQAHLEDEQAKLHAKQSAFKRQAGSGSMEANEEFQAFSSACLFRIDILVARRARHEQLALKKYAEMDQQLNNDPRLAALHQAE